MANSSSIERDLNAAIRNRDNAKSKKNQAIYAYEHNHAPGPDRLKREIEDAERDIRRYDREIDDLQRQLDQARREEAKAKRGW